MEFDPADADLSLASLFTGWALADEIQRRLVADGFTDTRFADGVVFQHLVGGPMTISALAERLGVTQQAASKSVADLEKRGYLSREPDPADARARTVVLTERGAGVIEAARRHRAALGSELRQALGADRVEQARVLLVDVINLLGAAPALRARAARPPR
ncbi:MarR family winged helix-turn-helix transcriptional regulator [Kribbella swartbergensis]